MPIRPTTHACSLAAGVMFLLLVTLPARAADPILMFVLGFAKNLIESSMETNASKPTLAPLDPAPSIPAVALKAPATMTHDDLRTLVEDSFAYLDRSQRAELLSGLEKTLADPALAGQREAILGQFVTVATQIRFIYRRLDRLSDRQKQALAAQFAANFRNLSPEQQRTLSRQLQQRALPLPMDLNEMMLTALATPP